MNTYGHTLAEAVAELREVGGWSNSDDILTRAAYHEAGHVCAALVYSIPIIRVTIDPTRPHMYRGRYRDHADMALANLVTLCLSGPASEQFFCGAINDGSDQTDIDMARHYLAAHGGFDLLLIGVEIARLRDSANALVRTPFARQRIPLIADALLKRGSLTGTEISELS